MSESTVTGSIAQLDDSRVTKQLVLALCLLSLQLVLEVFDYFIVGFLVSAIAPSWHLTFGQTSIILMASGLGTIFGSLGGGKIADSWGRIPVIVISGFIFSVSAGAIGLLPEGSWIAFSALRFGVGVGFGATTSAVVTLIVELIPARHRTVFASATQIPLGLGVLVASLSASVLLPHIGWRGLAALGVLPVLSTLIIWAIVPESVRWQFARGYFDKGRRGLEFLTGRKYDGPFPQMQIAIETSHQRLLDLFKYPRQFWLVVAVFLCTGLAAYSVLLWGPIILSNILSISAHAAAGYFVYVMIAGLLGRVVFTIIPAWVGRRRAGEIMGYCAALTLAGAAVLHNVIYNGMPVFLLFIIASEFFFEGGFSNMLPYATEIFPVQLAASGTGLSQATLGFARIVSPLLLTVFAGGNAAISPTVMKAIMVPLIVSMGISMLLVALAFTFLGIDTRKLATKNTSVSD